MGNPGLTNGETLEWLKSLSFEKCSESMPWKTNKLLTETINSRNKDCYVKIKEVDGINEMQRKILQINDVGTIKTSIITQQFLSDPGLPCPVYGSGSLSLTYLVM